MKELIIGDITIKIPIIQGGMGAGISWSSLASAVTNAGGIGIISAVGTGILEEDFHNDPQGAHLRGLVKKIRETRQKTDGVIGVNILIALTNANELMIKCCEEGVNMLFLSAGLPLTLPDEVVDNHRKKGGIKLVPIISSTRALDLVIKTWWHRYNILPDMVAVEGALSGGHLAFAKDTLDEPKNTLDCLIPEFLRFIKETEDKHQVKIPLIAEGGIYSGEDIYKYMKMGASGVMLGTRFVATLECDADYLFKEAYVRASEEDIILFKSPLGLWARAIRNPFMKRIAEGYRPKFHCRYHCLKTCKPKEVPFCLAEALINAKTGNMDEGLILAGPNAWKVDQIVSVNELMSELVNEFQLSSLKS